MVTRNMYNVASALTAVVEEAGFSSANKAGAEQARRQATITVWTL